jgi:hypothetical protein
VSTKKPKRRHRHSYSPELASLICERIAVDGLALKQICQDAAMPARSTLFLWLRQRADFRQKYARAKWLQCHCLADDIVDLADGAANQGSEQQIAALHWRLSKLNPKRYH